jgi:hypothetical protein
MSAQRGSVETSSCTKTSGPSGVSRVLRENPRKKSSAETSGTSVIVSGASSSSTVYTIRSQEIAKFVEMRTRGSARFRICERSSGIVFVLPAG